MIKHWRQVALVGLSVALVMFGFLAGCVGRRGTSPGNAAPVPVPTFNEARAWDDLVAQVKFGPRVPGTEAQRQTRDWLVEQLRGAGASVELQPFAHVLGGRDIEMWNIVANIPGTGAEPREKVLLCAHWDSRPTADYDDDPALRMRPIDGANDGASGVAVLLEIARALRRAPIARDVTIVLFDGEDYGTYPDTDRDKNIGAMLLGSKYYAAHLPAPKPNWGILLDMIGDADLDIYREPISDREAKAVNDRVFTAARKLGYLRSAELPGFVDAPFRSEVEDDHVALINAGVPTVDLIDFDYPHWHRSQDTVDKCSPKSLKMVGEVVLMALLSK